jgi:hypothetical protein
MPSSGNACPEERGFSASISAICKCFSGRELAGEAPDFLDASGLLETQTLIPQGSERRTRG